MRRAVYGPLHRLLVSLKSQTHSGVQRLPKPLLSLCFHMETITQSAAICRYRLTMLTLANPLACDRQLVHSVTFQVLPPLSKHTLRLFRKRSIQHAGLHGMSEKQQKDMRRCSADARPVVGGQTLSSEAELVPPVGRSDHLYSLAANVQVERGVVMPTFPREFHVWNLVSNVCITVE